MDGWIKGGRNGWTDRCTDGWTDGCAERNKDMRMDERLDFGLIMGQKDGLYLLDGWMDRWTD